MDINPSSMPQMTMVAWARAENGSPIRQVISHDDGGYDRSLGIDYRGGNTGWSAFSGTGDVLGYYPVTAGEWVFLAAVYDQTTGTVTLYVNGNRYEEAGTLGPGWNTFRIGSNPSYGEYFQGAIDEVRIYNHALSDSEIGQLYNQFLSRSTTAVPTMTEWGMIIFIVLAGLGSVYSLRRQKRA